MYKLNHFLDQYKWVQFILFGLIFWLFFINLEINRGLDNELINGYHFWRKSDTYNQIQNYYYNGLNFFDFSMYYNQMDSGGKAAGEFPLFYYLIAIQKTIFGDHILLVKYNWIIVVFFGLFALTKIAFHYTKHYIYGLFIAVSLFLLPTYPIYLIEFMPDPIALHFTIIGLYFLLKYHIQHKKINLIIAMIFICWAGMTKPYFLIPYLAFLCVYGIQLIKAKELSIKHLIYFTPLIPVVAWYTFMIWYNNSVECDCFLSSAKPIWELSAEEHELTIFNFKAYWLPSYMSTPVLCITIVCILFITIYKPLQFKKELLYFVFSLTGATAFVLLFYGMFMYHDYYIWPTIFLLPLILILTFQKLNTFRWWNSLPILLIGIGLITLTYFESNYSWVIRNSRLKDPFITHAGHYSKYLDLSYFLDKNGVTKDKFVIAFSDKTPAYALSLLNRKGWSGYQTFYLDRTLPELMAQGADYLIIHEMVPKEADSIMFDQNYLEMIADTNNIILYKLVDPNIKH